MKVLTLVLALALLPLQFRIAAATSYPVLYVRSNGLDFWPCGTSPSQPCKSVETAVNNANVYATTTIRVAAGEYAESISILNDLPTPHSGPLSIEGGWNADFTVQRQDPALTRITSSDNGAVITIILGTSELVDLRLAYLTLHGTTDLQRLGIQANASQATVNLAIEHCRLATYRGEAVSLFGGNFSTMTFTLDDSTLQGNYQWPANNPWSGAGIYANLLSGSTGNFTLTKNRIIGNQAVVGGGLSFSVDGGAALTATLENNILAENQASTGGGGAISATTSGTGTMELFLTNNTITNNSVTIQGQGTGIDLRAFDFSSLKAYLTNTIVWETGTTDILMWRSGLTAMSVTADFSIIGDVDNSGATYTPKSSVLNSPPLLNASYHLSGASLARDKGICGIKPFNFYIRIAPYDDIDGDPRPGFNTILGCDIGADEYTFPWILFNPLFSKK